MFLWLSMRYSANVNSTNWVVTAEMIDFAKCWEGMMETRRKRRYEIDSIKKSLRMKNVAANFGNWSMPWMMEFASSSSFIQQKQAPWKFSYADYAELISWSRRLELVSWEVFTAWQSCGHLRIRVTWNDKIRCLHTTHIDMMLQSSLERVLGALLEM